MSITAGAQIGINAASSVVGGLVGLGTSALQNKYNKELADYQNDINISNWNMQNEYNSPINQRKRLEEAGLNPALMYGNGGGSTGNATQSIAPYQRMGVDIGNNMLQSMQMANLAATIRKTNAEADNQEAINPYAADTAKSMLDNLQSKTEVNYSAIEKNRKDMAKMDVDIDVAKKTIEKMNSEISLQISQAKTEEEKAKLLSTQRELSIMQQGLILAQTETEKSRNQQITVDTVIRSMDAAFQRELGFKPGGKFEEVALQVAGNSIRSLSSGITKIGEKVGKAKDNLVNRYRERRNQRRK